MGKLKLGFCPKLSTVHNNNNKKTEGKSTKQNITFQHLIYVYLVYFLNFLVFFFLFFSSFCLAFLPFSGYRWNSFDLCFVYIALICMHYHFKMFRSSWSIDCQHTKQNHYCKLEICEKSTIITTNWYDLIRYNWNSIQRHICDNISHCINNNNNNSYMFYVLYWRRCKLTFELDANQNVKLKCFSDFLFKENNRKKKPKTNKLSFSLFHTHTHTLTESNRKQRHPNVMRWFGRTFHLNFDWSGSWFYQFVNKLQNQTIGPFLLWFFPVSIIHLSHL